MNNSEAIKIIKGNYPSDMSRYEMLRKALDMSIELLELDIVKCRDCKNIQLRDGYKDRYICTRWNNTVTRSGYCNYGERK